MQQARTGAHDELGMLSRWATCWPRWLLSGCFQSASVGWNGLGSVRGDYLLMQILIKWCTHPKSTWGAAPQMCGEWPLEEG